MVSTWTAGTKKEVLQSDFFLHHFPFFFHFFFSGCSHTTAHVLLRFVWKHFWTRCSSHEPPRWSLGFRLGSVRGDWTEILFFFLRSGCGGHADERLIDMVSGSVWWIILCVQTLRPWPVMAVAAFSASHCCGSFKKIWFSLFRNIRQSLSLRCLTSI